LTQSPGNFAESAEDECGDPMDVLLVVLEKKIFTGGK
jgi:hypothetical protein